MGVAGLGDRALAAMVSRGVFRGREAEIPHLLAGLSEPREVPQFGHEGDRAGELDAAQGLERVNYGTEAPGGHLVVAFLLKPSKTFAMLRHRPDVCLEDNGLGGRGTDDLTAPAPVGWAPGGPTGRADVGSQEKSLEAMLGRLEIPQGICAGTA